jgi:hypothetical protein
VTEVPAMSPGLEGTLEGGWLHALCISPLRGSKVLSSRLSVRERCEVNVIWVTFAYVTFHESDVRARDRHTY